MSYQINPNELEELVDIGIPHTEAVKALKLYKSKALALEHLFPSPNKQKKKTSIDDLTLAIQNSLQDHEDPSLFDTSNPESQLRFEYSPVGLKNTKNICYFNSLIQTYFMIPKFIKEILTFKQDPSNPNNSSSSQSSNIKLIEELQFLFASMILGNKKCIDPTSVLNTLLDESGQQMEVGEQKDIGEFNLNFIARIEEGLKAGESEKHTEVNANLVSQLFYAKQVEFLKAKEENGEAVEVKNSTLFGQLSLDANEKELHRAWDKAYHNLIEEYMTPMGYKTFATQDIWPEKLPGILLFQIQRVIYDPKLKQSKKINSEFRFPERLYGDRYIMKNREIYLGLRDSILKIKRKIEDCERELAYIKNYKGSGYDIISILNNVSKFLDTQQYSVVGKKKQIEHLLEVEETSIINARDVVDEFREAIEKQEASLRLEVSSLQKELDDIFDRDDLKHYEYCLHSILIHQGSADAGHYYAYIFDIEEKIWRRYSDTYIKKVTSEEVMKNAIGNEDASAYCLIYIYRPYIDNSGVFLGSVENLIENYSKIIPDSVKDAVLKANDQFLYEIDEFKLQQKIMKIKKLYDDRFTSIVNWSGENIPVEKQLINIVIFIRMQRNENLARWFLLNICVFEITGNYLEHFFKDLVFTAKLELVFCKDQFGPNSLELSENEKVILQEHQARFRWKYFHARLNIYILDQMTGENFLQAVAGICNQIVELNDPSDEYQRLFLENLKCIALKISSYVNACVYDKEIEQALTWARHLAFVSTVTGNYDKSFANFIKYRVNCAVCYLKKYLPGYYSADVKEKFDEILSQIGNLTAVESFDIGNIEDRLRSYLKGGENLYIWMDYSTSIAWEYYEVLRKFRNSLIYDWAITARRVNERVAQSNDDAVSLERKNGIVPKLNW